MKSFLRHPAVLRAIAGFMLGLVMMVVFNPMAAHAAGQPGTETVSRH